MGDSEPLTVLLRTGVYVASGLSAGGTLFYLCAAVPHKSLQNSVRPEILLGCVLLLFVEPVRYFLFQLSISAGDIGLAFSPALRWMGFETPMGQAASVRVAAAVLLLLTWHRSRLLAAATALAIVGSFTMEGHTASHDQRWLMATLLFVHLAVVHWWFGALWPLIACSKTLDHKNYLAMVNRFSQIAIISVPVLLVVGAVLLGVLTQWKLNLAEDYQQRFTLKLIAVTIILMIAAYNKLQLTPLLLTNPLLGAARLRSSVTIELVIAILILGATAYAIQTGPRMSHP